LTSAFAVDLRLQGSSPAQNDAVRVRAVGLFCAAHVAHGSEITADFSVWVLFYGPQK
jgi:hypothetical protein